MRGTKSRLRGRHAPDFPGMAAATVLACVAMASAAAAQPVSGAMEPTQAQLDRFDKIAEYTLAGATCEDLGFKADPNLSEAAGAALRADPVNAGLNEAATSKLLKEATTRRERMFKADKDAFLHGMKGNELKNLTALFVHYGQQCIRALSDPVFSQLLTAPPNFNLQQAAASAADEILEPAGYASWQTRPIQARGDLMRVAGGCRTQIGAARSDALFATYAKSDNVRARQWYRTSFDEGLVDDDIGSFTKSQCERVIGELTKDASSH
jgi:hypothetical protein